MLSQQTARVVQSSQSVELWFRFAAKNKCGFCSNGERGFSVKQSLIYGKNFQYSRGEKNTTVSSSQLRRGTACLNKSDAIAGSQCLGSDEVFLGFFLWSCFFQPECNRGRETIESKEPPPRHWRVQKTSCGVVVWFVSYRKAMRRSTKPGGDPTEGTREVKRRNSAVFGRARKVVEG